MMNSSRRRANAMVVPTQAIGMKTRKLHATLSSRAPRWRNLGSSSCSQNKDTGHTLESVTRPNRTNATFFPRTHAQIILSSFSGHSQTTQSPEARDDKPQQDDISRRRAHEQLMRNAKESVWLCVGKGRCKCGCGCKTRLLTACKPVMGY